MIDTAKCCLQQLKAHARLISQSRYRENDTLNNCFNLHTRYDGQPANFNRNSTDGNRNTVELSCSRNMTSLLHPNNATPQANLNESLSTGSVADYGTMGYQQVASLNEKPPSYESIIKSSSLPSYCHFSLEEEKISK